MHPALQLLAADDGAVVVDDVGVDGVVVAEGDDGRDELGRSSGADRMSGGQESRLEMDVSASWTVLWIGRNVWNLRISTSARSIPWGTWVGFGFGQFGRKADVFGRKNGRFCSMHLGDALDVEIRTFWLENRTI